MQINEITILKEDPETIGNFLKFVKQVIAAYNKAQREEIQTFVTQQVLELTRMRANMPNDQLTREVTKRAIEAGINKGTLGPRETTANLIKELVPTIDRQNAKPDVTTDIGSGLGNAPEVGDSGTGSIDSGSTDSNLTSPKAPQKPTVGDKGGAPTIDPTAAAAQQLSKFQQAYGVGTGANGLPTLFRDKFLNPALAGEYKSAPWAALAKELQGEIPQAVARVVANRIIQWHGSDVLGMKGDLQSLLPDKGDPEIDDQIKTLTIMIKLVEKLKKDAARK